MIQIHFCLLAALVGAPPLWGAVACGGRLDRARTPSLPPMCDHVKGSPTQMTTRAGTLDLYGFLVRIGEPQVCGKGRYFDVLTSGPRRFSKGILRWRRLCPASMPEAVCKARCLGRPGPDDPCRVVSGYHLALEAMRQLRALGYSASVGISGCGEPSGTPGYERITLIVHHWGAVDAALRSLGGRMRAWRVGGKLRVAVKPIACGVAL